MDAVRWISRLVDRERELLLSGGLGAEFAVALSLAGGIAVLAGRACSDSICGGRDWAANPDRTASHVPGRARARRFVMTRSGWALPFRRGADTSAPRRFVGTDQAYLAAGGPAVAATVGAV